MNLVFVAPGEKVATWRTIWPAAELERRGHQVGIYGAVQAKPPAEEPTDATYVLHVVNKAWKASDTGRVYTLLDLVRWGQGMGRTVLSIDDDWTRMLEIQFEGVDELTRIVHAQIPELVKAADSVIVATPHLAEVYGQWAREIHIVPNTLPEWVLQMPRPPQHERVVWMGEMYVHGMDWDMLQPYAADLPPLYLVGTGKGAADVIRGWGAQDVWQTEAILDQKKLYREMGRGVAAIIPLKDTPFNRGKSWSKPLEFMARGVQPIASEHAEYRRLDALTDGGLPTFATPEELVEAVTEAWDNRPDGTALPQKLREAGLTMETGGGDAWEKALA